MTTSLSPHFTLDELTYSDTANSSGIDNTPDPQSRSNLARVAQVMEQVRQMLGNHPVLISSGYRCYAVNAAVGGLGVCTTTVPVSSYSPKSPSSFRPTL